MQYFYAFQLDLIIFLKHAIKILIFPRAAPIHFCPIPCLLFHSKSPKYVNFQWIQLKLSVVQPQFIVSE